MSELSKSDAELAFKYLNDDVRADIEHEAFDETLSQWRSERPDDLDTLEAAHDDDDIGFEWQDIDLSYERSQADGEDELTPHTGTGDAPDDVHGLARDFGWDFVASIRDEVRGWQSATVLSPREFVALVLSESRLTYDEAAREMDIASGTFASKMSREVNPEVAAARETARLSDRLS